jgi:hypothetical protein
VSDLVAFLLARVDEDEAVARGAAAHITPSRSRPGPAGENWSATYDQVRSDWHDGMRHDIAEVGTFGRDLTAHIARHDPARVLAECEAKRRMVSRLQAYTDALAATPGDRERLARWSEWDLAARYLALPYASHPDYRDEYKTTWRP